MTRYRVTPETQLDPDVEDLDHTNHTWPDGTAMTEENTAAYSQARKNPGGRPSLGAKGPSPHIAFRVDPTTRRALDELAERDGTTASKIARTALEDYLARRGAA